MTLIWALSKGNAFFMPIFNWKGGVPMYFTKGRLLEYERMMKQTPRPGHEPLPPPAPPKDRDCKSMLCKVLEYIPPQSIATLIGQFVRECELNSKNGGNLFEDMSGKYSIVCDFENSYTEILQDI
jgi:hypothetical protein